MHVICRAEKAVYLPGTTGKNFRAKHMILADQNWKEKKHILFVAQ